jgi:GAF domain-containing protein
MLNEGELIGSFTLYRQEVRPFTNKQIALVTNFGAQAVIAIENARLLNELRGALVRQTATSEVLQVISRSPGDLEQVFAAMLKNVTTICCAAFANLLLYDGCDFHVTAMHNASSEYAHHRQLGSIVNITPKNPLRRIAATRRLQHIPDIRNEDVYVEGEPAFTQLVEKAGARTLLNVPLLKEGDLVGVIGIYRHEVRPFADEQIELVQNFAAQAVIAIENARLLKELRERTEQVEAQSQEVVKLNQQLEQRVADQVGEIERMSRLRRFLPPQVADLIVASGSEKQLESHRREITALFCDLRGFTGFSESADPGDVMTLLREYHEAIGASIINTAEHLSATRATV